MNRSMCNVSGKPIYLISNNLHPIDSFSNFLSEAEYIAWRLFWIISLINLIILITELILKLVKKRKLALKNYVILAGQLSKLIIAAILIILLVGSMNPLVCTALCIGMILCAAVCLISGIMTGIVVFTKKELPAFQYVWRIIYMLCCLFVCGYTVHLELFHFWM